MRLHIIILLLALIANVNFAGLTLDRVDADFGHGCQYYTYTNDLASAKSVAAPTSEITVKYASKYKASDVSSGAWYALETVERTHDVWNALTDCRLVKLPCDPKNFTEQEKAGFVCDEKELTYETEECGAWVRESFQPEEWLPFKSAKELPVGKTKLKYCATYKMISDGRGWAAEFDMIPSVDGVRYPEYAWFNTTWLYRAPCYVNTTISSSLVNFPAHCIIDTAALITAGKMNTSCQDLRATNATDSPLSHEIENGTCNTTKSVLWIGIPVTNASGNDTIYLYYGNPTATDGQNASGVWTAYTDVYHLSGSGISSTGRTNLTNATGSFIASKYGNGLNTSSGVVKVAYASGGIYWAPENLTVTCFYNGTSTSAYSWLMSVDKVPCADARWILGTGGSAASNKQFCYGSAAYPSVTGFAETTAYNAQTCKYNSSKTEIYGNGTLNNTASSTIRAYTSANVLSIGACEAAKYLTGVVDECRLSINESSTNKTGDWFKAEYTQTDSIGAEERFAIAPEVLNITLTPASPYTEDNLNCTFYARDNDSSLINTTAMWYKNGAWNQNQSLTNQAANATYSFILLAGNTTTGENWSCTGYASDNTSGSGTAASGNVTIRNDAPTISGMSLLPATAYKLDTLTCSALINDNNTALVAATFRWYMNSTLQTTTSQNGAANTTFTNISAPPHTQYTNWTCALDAYDGDNHIYQNMSVNISNNIPSVSLAITPVLPVNTSNLTCAATTADVDTDTLSGMFVWYINGIQTLYNDTYSGAPGIYTAILSGVFNISDNISCYANVTDTFNVTSVFSSNVTIQNNSHPSYNVTTNISFNSTFTYEEWTTYTTTFYEDYGPYALAILAYGFAFLVTRRYPATLISGGVGLLLVFFLSSNVMFLAAGILSMIIGFMYKQASG